MSKLTKTVTLCLLCIIFFSMAIQVNAAINDHLLLHYDFNDNAKDAGEKNNHGTMTGNVEIKDTDIGKAITFDGLTGYIDCPDVSLTDISKFTIAFWSNAVDLGESFSSILSSNGWSLEGDTHIIFADGKYYQFSVNGAPDTKFDTYPVPLNTWEHVTMTYDTEKCTVALYINGSLQEERQLEYLPALYIEGFAIGTWQNNDGLYERFYNGSLCDIRLYDSVLTADEIKELSTIKKEAPIEAKEELPIKTENILAVEPPISSVTPTANVQNAPQTNDSIQILAWLAVLSIIMVIIRLRKIKV